MKRTIVSVILAALALSTAGSALAQNSQIITLNDATPGIDVVVSNSPGTTGAVTLQLSGASVVVTDAAGNRVFQMADPRTHALELRFAPDSNAHTLTIERLPGVAQAFVQAASQTDLSIPVTAPTLVENTNLTPGLEADARLNQNSPAASFALLIPDGTSGQIQATFPGTSVSAQIIDASGSTVATLAGSSQIDGLSVTLEQGQYQMSVVNTQPSLATLATAQLMPATLPALPQAVATETAPAANPSTSQVANAPVCNVQIQEASINLRSGPGTGYSVLGYAFRGDQMVAGGTNIEGNWLLVSGANGSAWMSRSLGLLDGGCDQLTVYDIPYREASAPQIIVQPPANTSGGSSVFGSSNGYEHEEHESNEGGEHDD